MRFETTLHPSTWRGLEASARRDAERDLARLAARARRAGVPVTAESRRRRPARLAPRP